MPQRTNDFQHLVRLLHQAMAGTGAKITESAMVRIPELGDLREIDVLIETVVPPYAIKIAVEVKDHHRKLDVGDIEKISGKYQGEARVRVDKVVIVSRNGSTRLASKKAALLGIELRQLSETKETEWEFLAQISPTHQLLLPQLPHIADLQPAPPLPPGIFSPSSGKIVNKETRREIDSPMRYVATALRQQKWLEHPSLRGLIAVAKRERSSINLSFRMERFLFRLNGTDYPLEQLRFRIHWADKAASVDFHSYELTSGDGDLLSGDVKHGVATFHCDYFGDYKVDVLLPDGLHSKKVLLSMPGGSVELNQVLRNGWMG